jgi:hypothetical protein
MYAMQVVASSVFHTMLFPHNGKIVTIDQLTHYEPNQSGHIDNILPLIHSSDDLVPMVDVRPGLFHDPSLLGSYQGYPHPTPNTTNVCVVTSDGVEIPDAPPSRDSLNHSSTPSLTQEALPEEPPLGESIKNPPPMGQIPIWKMVP